MEIGRTELECLHLLPHLHFPDVVWVLFKSYINAVVILFNY